jgi:Pyruvate/2-oxoacid:ferredoxin oxidoreductase delta subunit
VAVSIVISQPLTQTADEAAKVQQLAEMLTSQGRRVLVVPDLYHLPDSDPLWAELRAWPGLLVVVTSLHARPAEWLLRERGVGAGGLQVVSTQDVAGPEEIAARLPSPDEPEAGAGDEPVLTVRRTDDEGDRWYPVLDKSRCVECQHCFQFCLFGVYDLDAEGHVRVTSPDNCKPGCPACARICQQSAVMFPLYHKDAAISGAPGQFVQLDAEGRKLFYGRSGARCPVCGQEGELRGRKARGQTPACAECGRPLPLVAEGPAAPSPDLADARDELDALLDQLEELSGGSR